MRIYLKSTMRKSINVFLGKMGAEEALEAAEREIMYNLEQIYRQVVSGEYVAYQRLTDGRIAIVHLSSRDNSIIEISHFYKGIPNYHDTCKSPEDMFCRVYLGRYINIKKI